MLVSVARIRVQIRNVGLQQVFPVLVAEESDRCVIEINPSTVRCGDKNTVLRGGKESTVSLFALAYGLVRQLSFTDIPYYHADSRVAVMASQDAMGGLPCEC